MFDGLEKAMKLGCAMLVIFVPLGLWKLIELIVYVINNVTISVK